MIKSDFPETARFIWFLRNKKQKDITSQKLADELEILLTLVPKG